MPTLTPLSLFLPSLHMGVVWPVAECVGTEEGVRVAKTIHGQGSFVRHIFLHLFSFLHLSKETSRHG